MEKLSPLNHCLINLINQRTKGEILWHQETDKEEIYLHLISWRKGRFANNTEVLQLLPTFTMYLKPPLPLEKFIVATILQNESVQMMDFPLCLAANPNEPTTENILLLENKFVERDWLPNDRVLGEVLENKGQVRFEVEMLNRVTLQVRVAESLTVAELMGVLVERVEVTVEDKEHYWLYKMSKETHEMVPYEGREHVG